MGQEVSKRKPRAGESDEKVNHNSKRASAVQERVHDDAVGSADAKERARPDRPERALDKRAKKWTEDYERLASEAEGRIIEALLSPPPPYSP